MLLLLSHFSHVRLCDPIDGTPILSAKTLDCGRYSLLETAPALRTRGEDKIELGDFCDLSQLSVRLDDFLRFQESSALFVYKNSQQFLAI